MGIDLYSSSNNIISDNTATDNSWSGIDLSSSSTGNTISGNTISGNFMGIDLYSSSNNIISENTATDNSWSGIDLSSSSTGNTICLNTFDNTNNGRSDGANHWNSTTSMTWVHDGRTLTGLLGNIWSDYNGFDCDENGIGDTPYNKILGGSEMDYHPIGGSPCVPGLEVEKIADPTFGSEGDLINFTVTITNNGSAPLLSVFVSDKLPAGLTYASSSTGGDNSGQHVNWTDVGPLASKASLTLWIKAKIDGSVFGTLTNQVDVTGEPEHGAEVESNATADVESSNSQTEGNLTLKKTADKSAVHRGEDINYTIELCNEGPVPLTNVTLWDVLPKGVELVSVSPEPSSTNLTWFIGTLGPRQCVYVYLRVRVPIVDINYDMDQGVSGTGFVNVHNDYDTHQGPESITNCAYAKSDLIETISSCASTGIVDPGTELNRREFGSGTYASEELTKMRTENKSIKTVTGLSAVHKPTTFSLPKGRSINYSTKWTEKSKGINTITGASMNEEYTFANKIDKDSSLELDKNGSTMKTEVQFEGTGHIGVLKKESTDAHPRSKPVYEASEDYVGRFKVYEMVDEYGKNVQSNKSVTGYGYVNVDKRVKDSQRTYESGTGSYASEEIIDTPTNYITKDINLVHGPANYSYSPRFAVSQDMLWSEGIWSKSGMLRGGEIFAGNNIFGNPVKTIGCINGTQAPTATYLGERYSSLDYLKKESVASGLNEMKTNASFSGLADYRFKAVGTNRTSQIDNEETYAGRYNITRNVILSGVSKYDRPHITVTKEGRMTTKWFNKTNANVAEYTITITNDGSSSLAPINVRDSFPPGAEYIGSSIRPSSLSRSDVNWTLLNLGIGNSVTIELTLNITEYAPDNIVNRVMVCAMKGDGCISAQAYSSLASGSMTCCPPEVFVDKTAELDVLDPTVVRYTIVVKNNANNTIAVTLTDNLPGYMSFLQASYEPSMLVDQFIQWVILDLAPGCVKTIEYTVRAARDGAYVNTVHVDAIAVDGTGYATEDAAAQIEVRSTGVAPKTTRYGGWQPPNWNMTSPDQGLTIDLSPDEDLVEESRWELHETNDLALS